MILALVGADRRNVDASAGDQLLGRDSTIHHSNCALHYEALCLSAAEDGPAFAGMR